jgi:hypothetical protein
LAVAKLFREDSHIVGKIVLKLLPLWCGDHIMSPKIEPGRTKGAIGAR